MCTGGAMVNNSLKLVPHFKHPVSSLKVELLGGM